MATRVGAVDLGTNSFLCLIAEFDDSGTLRILSDKLKIVRLGEGVHRTRCFSQGALTRAAAALEEFHNDLKSFGVKTVEAVATSAARDVTNKNSLLELGQRHGIPIRIISGEEEARLTFEGAVGGKGDAPGSGVIDVGGGSTELIHEWHDQKLHSVSWDIGCVRLTEQCVTADPPTEKCVSELYRVARQTIGPLREEPIEKLLAVAGTPTSLAAMELGIDFDKEKIEGFVIDAPMLERWIAKLSQLDQHSRIQIRGLDTGRADILLAGLVILRVALDRLNVEKMTVSTRGLRYGLARELAKQ